jgi:hypothetical protein
MTPHIPLIQRRAFIGSDPISAKRAEFGDSPREEFGGSRPEKKVRKKARRRPRDFPEVRGRAQDRDQDAPQPRGRARSAADDLPQVITRIVKIPYELGDLGIGQRNLARILVDYKSRYFRACRTSS